jgi:hypothetical protein
MFALISTEELEQTNQIMVKQLKNRYNDPTANKRFMIGVDRSKMKLYDLEQSAQKGLTDANLDIDRVDKPQKSNYNIGDAFNKRSRDFSSIKL